MLAGMGLAHAQFAFPELTRAKVAVQKVGDLAKSWVLPAHAWFRADLYSYLGFNSLASCSSGGAAGSGPITLLPDYCTPFLRRARTCNRCM